VVGGAAVVKFLRALRFLLVGAGLFVFYLAFPLAAFGQTCTTNTSGVCTYVLPADPTGGTVSSLGSTMVNWMLNYGVPVFFGLIALGICLRLVVRLVRRGADVV